MQGYPSATREQVEKLLEETRKGTGRSGRARKKRTPWQWFTSILSTLIILTLAGTLGMLIKTKVEGGYPQLFGFRIFQVETGSMIPTIPIGSIIIVREPKDPANLAIGTVITYRMETATITHRIVDYEWVEDEETGELTRYYRTKGDNPENALDDWKVAPSDIMGELIWNFSLSLT